MDTNDFKLKLVEEISNCDEILGIGQTGDIFYMNGIDVMPMYFSVTDMEDYIDEILAGKHLEKEGSFYPIGRLASITICKKTDDTFRVEKEQKVQLPRLNENRRIVMRDF